LINECNHSYFSLDSFLARIDLGPIEQQFHIARYIIRICLKAIQEMNSQLKHDQFIILPLNLYFNDRCKVNLTQGS
jgi:tmRNA-binding protein